MLYRLALITSALFAVAVANATTVMGGYTASNGTITGLYDDTGASTDPTINLTSVTCVETYDVTFPMTNFTTYDQISGVWHTKLKFHFSTSSWTSASNSAAFGVQLCHFIVNGSTGASSNPPVAYFALPASNPLSFSGGIFSASNSPTVVNYIFIYKNQLTVDPSDGTGQTGYVEWNCDSTTPYPWALLPGTETVGGTGTSFTSLSGVLWLFVRPSTNNGVHNQMSPSWPAYPT